MQQAFVGIDVGTSSARAGIFDENGTLLATARHPITLWHEAGGVVEQSSSEIWSACSASVRAAMAEAAIPPSAVKGLGFDATCSLVVLDAQHSLVAQSLNEPDTKRRAIEIEDVTQPVVGRHRPENALIVEPQVAGEILGAGQLARGRRRPGAAHAAAGR